MNTKKFSANWILVLSLIVINYCGTSTNAARILGIFPLPAKSHDILGTTISVELAKRGHSVTIISPFPISGLTGNFTKLNDQSYRIGNGLLQISQTEVMKTFKLDKRRLLNSNTQSPITEIVQLYEMTNYVTELTFNDTKFQELVTDESKQFDLILLENFNTAPFFALGHRFQAPIVLLSTLPATTLLNDWFSNPAPISYLPDVFLSYSDRMSILQRFHNTIVSLFHCGFRYFINLPLTDQIVQKYFSGYPSIDELKNRISLVIMNSHSSVNLPRPIMSGNMIEIGGYHIVEQNNQLSESLKEFLDNANEGVIYFSMGSNLKSTFFPDEKRAIFLKVFASLPYQIIWKWEDENLPGKPSNVRIEKWLPQQDVLAHKNVKLFITHGGLLSTTEAIYYGVPLVGMPMFGDQRLNLANAELAGYAKQIDYLTLSEEMLSNAIRTILDNPSYRQNIRKRSKIMRDRPMKPLDTAIYWIEYVLRHDGAYHLRSDAALELYWFQYYLLDIFAIIIASLLIVWCLMKRLIRSIFCQSTPDVIINCKKTN